MGGRLAALCGDEAEEVDAGYDARDYGDGAVRPSCVRALLRAHQSEVVAVEPTRQLFERGVETHLVFLQGQIPVKSELQIGEMSER